MSALLGRRSLAPRRRASGRTGRVAAGVGCTAAGALASLEDAVLDAWEGLATHRSVDCLICGAGMAPRYGASGHAPVGGRCSECGASLS